MTRTTNNNDNNNGHAQHGHDGVDGHEGRGHDHAYQTQQLQPCSLLPSWWAQTRQQGEDAKHEE